MISEVILERSGRTMTPSASLSARQATLLITVATLILMLTMGARQSSGLFLLAITQSTGVAITAISFALAVGQLVWGAVQPVFGAMADRYGAHRMIVAGGLVMALGAALTPFLTSDVGLMITFGFLLAAGAGAGSFSILIGATARSLSPDKRSTAAGIINAGGSLGQFLIAPLMQLIIATLGWASGMYAMAFIALLTIPLAFLLRPRQPAVATPSAPVNVSTPPAITLREQLRIAARDPSYIYLSLGFFTCGFHVAFLVTHFPSDLQMCGLTAGVAANSIALIGLFNIAGSLSAGWLGQRYRMKYLLAGIYASRAALIVVYLLMPKTALNVYLFAGGLGLTWLATVPPTSGLIGKLFGVRYLGTLFGLALLSHQIGGFLGAYSGGKVLQYTGSYQWVWYADIALAVAAAVCNLPIREAKPIPRLATAT
jgi:MFS family permease